MQMRYPERVEGAPAYFTAHQVAQMLGFDIKRVYQIAERLGALQLGTRIIFPAHRLPGMPESPWERLQPKIGRPRKRPAPDPVPKSDAGSEEPGTSNHDDDTDE